LRHKWVAMESSSHHLAAHSGGTEAVNVLFAVGCDTESNGTCQTTPVSLLNEVLQTQIKHHGDESNVEVAATKCELADAYGAMGDYATQVRLLDEVLQTQMKHHGDESNVGLPPPWDCPLPTPLHQHRLCRRWLKTQRQKLSGAGGEGNGGVPDRHPAGAYAGRRGLARVRRRERLRPVAGRCPPHLHRFAPTPSIRRAIPADWTRHHSALLSRRHTNTCVRAARGTRILRRLACLVSVSGFDAV